MKKFSIKALLAVVLILVLVLSLVACGEKDDPVEEVKCANGHTNANEDTKCDVCGETIPKCAEHTDANGNKKCDVCGARIKAEACNHVDADGNGACDLCNELMEDPNKITSDVFFQNLWDAAAPIGGTPIGEDEDIAVSMDMSLSLSNEGILADLGMNIGLVLDKTTNGAHSAAKIGVYNHEDGAVIATVYYFLDDPYNFYIEALGQSFKMAVDYNSNEAVAAQLDGILNTALGTLLGEETLKDFPEVAKLSVMGIIDRLTENFGEAWNLDAPINAITGLLGVNIGELLGSEDMAGTLEWVNGILVPLATQLGIKNFKGIDTEALATSDSVILDLLCGVGPLVFRNVEELENGEKTYLDLSSKGIIGKLGFILNTLPMGIGTLVKDMEEVSLSYTKDADGVIDSFGMNIVLGTSDKPIGIGISINDIAITGVDAAEADEVLGADKETFKDYFEFNTGLTIEIAPETLVVKLEDRDAMDFAGTYEMNLRGQVDFMNETNNLTRILATIDHNGTTIARLTFDGTALALGVDSSSPVVKFIVEEGVSLLLQSLAEAKQVDGQDDTWLQGLVLALANVAYTDSYDVAALKAATDFTINPALTINNGVAISDISLADIKTHGARLITAAMNAIGGMLGGSESAGVEEDLAGIVEQAWLPNIYTLLGLISRAVDGNIKTGLSADIKNIGQFIVSLFEEVEPTDDDPRTQTGPLSVEELCYGNLEEGIFGIFTLLDGEDWNAQDFANAVFGGCAWAGQDVLISLMNTGIEVEVKSDLSGSIKLTNGNCYINISFEASLAASDTAPDWSAVEFPNVSTWACYPLN